MVGDYSMSARTRVNEGHSLQQRPIVLSLPVGFVAIQYC